VGDGVVPTVYGNDGKKTSFFPSLPYTAGTRLGKVR